MDLTFTTRDKRIQENTNAAFLLLQSLNAPSEDTPENNAALSQLIRGRIDIAACNAEKDTLLHLAAHSGRLQMAIQLVEKGAPIRQQNKQGLEALHLAAMGGHEPVLTMLLDKGCPIGTRSSEGLTALHLAASEGHTGAILLLLGRGADIEAKSTIGNTALQEAAKYGQTQTVRFLLDYGADIEVKNKRDETALHWAADNGHTEAVGLLLENGANIWAKDLDNKNTLDYAEGKIKNLIDAHIDYWKPQYEAFLKNEFTPQTPAEWLGLATVMPLSDPQAYSSVKDRVEQLMDWHKGLKALRTRAASPTIGELGV